MALTVDDDGGVLIYEDGDTRVRRVRLSDGESVICKQPLGPGSLARMLHEAHILRRLAGVAGVSRLATRTHHSMLVLEDEGGLPVAETLCTRPPAIPEVARLAVELASIVAAIHRRGVVHKDLSPSNILLVARDHRPVIIDFDLASTFAEERPQFTHHRDIVGTLPYLAPEQTGRTGMPVDQRADLYALGAVLYELVAARAPFERGDELQMVHDILVRVPTPLAELDGNVPQPLSDIVARLLEKEPDRRYQSADGLVHDLRRLLDPRAGRFALGERDFPPRLAAPSRLIGRGREIDALRDLFEDALTGRTRVALVAGAPGVGKSALINGLRPTVAARHGWFVAGKFDQYRPEAAGGAVVQAMRGLGRLLLAEAETRLVAQRERISRVLGTNADLVAAVLPEFARALRLTPETPTIGVTDVEVRLRQAMLDILDAVVSTDHPVVMVIDDLQWADPAALGLLDAVLTGGGPSGLLLVGAYRAKEVDLTHPLSAMLSRWDRLGVAPPLLHLENLPSAELGHLLAEMLRLPLDRALDLAARVTEWTGGNPYDTVEMINALRRDGVLVLGEAGWSWDSESIRHYVGRGDVVDLLRDRIARLPAASRASLQTMACIGGEVRVGLLAVAAGVSDAVLRERLAPPLEDGLLVMDRDAGRDGDGGRDAVRFRHDRVQQAVHDMLDTPDRLALRLAMARRLASTEYSVEAAVQYLPAMEGVTAAEERRRAADLFRVAAMNATRTSNHGAAERFLAAAIAIRDGLGHGDDPETVELEIERHAGLYSLGRLDEADVTYTSVERRCPDAVRLAPAACVQVSSLSQRGRHREAADLSLELLRRLGFTAPDESFGAEIPARLDELARWAAHLDLAEDIQRPEIDNLRILAVVRLFNRLMPTAFFLGDRQTVAWTVSESQRIWAEYGPSAGLVANLSGIGAVAVQVRGDYRLGHMVGRHMLAVGEARGYEPETSILRHRHTLIHMTWNEPIERCIDQARSAHEGLVRGGELQLASHTCHTSLPAVLECAESLGAYAAEIRSSAMFAVRIGSEHVRQYVLAHRRLIGALCGESTATDAFGDAPFDENLHLAAVAANPLAAGTYRIYRALAAALLGDQSALSAHTAQAMPMLRFVPGYPVALARLLRALALAEEIRQAPPPERTALLAEFDESRDWLAQRAVDAPDNFRHLLWLVDAERAWAVDDFRAAAHAFDTAVREIERRKRPWHLALAVERAGEFQLAHGLERAGRRLLAEARRHYRAWGATAKVQQLERAHPHLGAEPFVDPVESSSGHRRSGTVRAETVDMLAILRASQALSSETDLDRLRTEVVQQLTALTGATDVVVVLHNDDTDEWFLPRTDDSGRAAVPVEEAGAAGLLPITAFRYATRVGEPVVVEDATRDDRFARDAYLVGRDRCSLLAVPILHQGSVQAVLILANDLSSGAFTVERLDAVMLIAGQLAVSLRNALLYGSLEERVAERTASLEEANRQLETLSITDPLTKLANRRRFNEVLHAEWRRTVRTARPLGIAMIDVDHFKGYNDHYGHLAGDECLRQVASALQSSARDATDLVCRYGGEEFAIIVPETGGSTMLKVGERARAAVRNLAAPHAAGTAGIVTVSVGVAAAVASTGAGVDELIASADAALYRAKRDGRDLVRGGEEPSG
ncbi:serine/threonine protein kinase [Virgisporangium aliadipatigenens]|uniref:Serine/threonine protein kinase n=1 Tax=Virgisporangium aliadipatigenens TaxID=741659 RepID=A0A8J3YQM1_9ACTN|nr:diguanylate cyclase [Virgisporangium aliadipatigenens]GIJ48797.1 serine/threonine protein kinase [Virgisporangium aliadipatigenens]